MTDQARLLAVLAVEPTRVFTNDELCRRLRWDSRRLRLAGDALRAERKANADEGPADVWGTGWRLWRPIPPDIQRLYDELDCATDSRERAQIEEALAARHA